MKKKNKKKKEQEEEGKKRKKGKQEEEGKKEEDSDWTYNNLKFYYINGFEVDTPTHIGNNFIKKASRINFLINLIGYLNNNINHVCDSSNSNFFLQLKCYYNDCSKNNDENFKEYVDRWFNLLHEKFKSINKLNDNVCDVIQEYTDEVSYIIKAEYNNKDITELVNKYINDKGKLNITKQFWNHMDTLPNQDLKITLPNYEFLEIKYNDVYEKNLCPRRIRRGGFIKLRSKGSISKLSKRKECESHKTSRRKYVKLSKKGKIEKQNISRRLPKKM